MISSAYSSKKIIAIVGPTATGKSNLAIKLAKKYKGEIISADSRAIYRGLPIGTATPRGARHHLINFLEPQKTFSAHDFAKRAGKLITNIQTPIIVGGTGFWIDALLYPNLLEKVSPNKKLRRILEKKSLKQLFSQLKKLDLKRAKTIQKTNKRRLIRAIEIARSKNRSTLPTNYKLQATSYSILFLGLTLPNTILKKRIEKRFLNMLKQGLVAETKNLTKQVSKRRLKEIGLTYPIVASYIDGKISRKEMIEKSVNATYHYAKRQKTWFRRNKNIHWVKNSKTATDLAKDFLD